MKKILSLLLALTLVFTLVACNNEKDTTLEPDTSNTQTETESTDTNDTQTSENDTDENSSDTKTPRNSTPTSTEASKPTTNSKPTDTTSNKDNITSSNTSKPATSNKDNTASSRPSTSATSEPTTSKEPTLPSNEEWNYKNGGYDYIIKYMGTESVKIQINPSDLPPETKNETEYDYEKIVLERYNFVSVGNNIYFCQSVNYKKIKIKERPGYDINGGHPTQYYFCKISEDGSQYKVLVSESEHYGYMAFLGYKNEYFYFMLGPSWAPYGDVCKIKTNDLLNNLLDKKEMLFDGAKLFNDYFDYGYIIKSKIINDTIYYSIDSFYDEGVYDYKIKLDGTNLERVS